MAGWTPLAVALSLSAWLFAGCAHTVNALDRVEIGMDRETAAQNVSATLADSFVQGSTEYLIYQVVTSLLAVYGDSPNSVLYVRLENGAVVAKGVVGKREEARIKQIDPSFDLRTYQKE